MVDAVTAAVPLLQSERWLGIAGLRHGFSTRAGGVSIGPFASLNLSTAVGDSFEAVEQNWQILGAAAGVTHGFARMRQVHGAHVASVAGMPEAPPVADGLISASPNMTLAVLTADCVPILLVDPSRRAIAAVHAGWRGTAARIAARAVEALAASFGVQPSHLLALIGPAIDSCCYEVGAEVGEAFSKQWGRLPRSYHPTIAGKAQLALRDANCEILVDVGVPSAAIEQLGPCTACHAEELFSHRASGGSCGRQVGFVGWAPPRL